MEKQVTTIGNGKEFIPIESIHKLASITATQESPKASDKYNFFSSLHVLESLKEHNWLPVLAQQQRANKEDRMGYQKHMIRFRQPGVVVKNVGDVFPEIVFTNSHDTTSAYWMMAGFFALACLNGMIVSEAEFGAIRIPHVGFKESDVIDASYRIIEDVPRLVDKIQEYRVIPMSAEAKEVFAEEALQIKFDEEANLEGGLITVGDRRFSLNNLLKPIRHSYEEPTLWNVFNTVQEKIIKGNRFEYTVRHLQNGSTTIQTKVRGIKAIDENIRINRGLWNLMENMRQILATA